MPMMAAAARSAQSAANLRTRRMQAARQLFEA
jgi:hypothetical protein